MCRYVDKATLGRGGTDFRTVEVAFAVGQRYLVACLQPQYADCVSGFFFGQFGLRLYVGGVEYVHDCLWFLMLVDNIP